MTHHLPTPSLSIPRSPARRRRGWLLAVAVTATLALAATTAVALLFADPLTRVPAADSSAPSTAESSESAGGAATSEADGYLPWGVTPFDTRYPGISRMDAALLDALQRASTQAYADGVGFFVTSGWRSAAQQEQMLSEATTRYGSRQEAARWVATAATSLHVQGKAADVDGSGTQDWIAQHGATFGLCLIYDNEPWHVEFRADATRQGCPRPYADPTADPRLAG